MSEIYEYPGTHSGTQRTKIDVIIPAEDTKLHIRVEHIILLALLGLIFIVRISNIQYNTLFVDEAIYANVGAEALVGNFTQNATDWMAGSYMYPATVAIVNKLGGVAAIRFFSAIVSMISAIFVYLVTLHTFNQRAALIALLVFGLTGVSISLGQLAVYDVLAAPFLAATLYYMVAATTKTGRTQKFYFVIGSIAFSLTFLSKYVLLLCLPAVVGIVVLLCLSRGDDLRSIIRKLPWMYFIAPMGIICGAYVGFYFSEIKTVLTGQFSTQAATRPEILQQMWDEMITPVIIIAMLGLLYAAWTVVKHYRTKTGKSMVRPTIIAVVLSVMLMLAILSIPLYQLWGSNIRSLWKHYVYSLIFLAPLAGYALASFFDWVGSGRLRMAPLRIVAAIAVIIGAYSFISKNLDRNWGFQHSWPTAAKVIDYVKTLNINENSLVLGSGSAIYEYYIPTTKNRDVWQSTWYMNYKTFSGPDAMKAAINDCALDAAIMDDYYFPEMNTTLQPLLLKAGYKVGFETTEKTSVGTINTRVFIPNTCTKRKLS
ncbi:MAG: glycosyltransferase family 39 protein [Chloroflexota bacterium]